MVQYPAISCMSGDFQNPTRDEDTVLDALLREILRIKPKDESFEWFQRFERGDNRFLRSLRAESRSDTQISVSNNTIIHAAERSNISILRSPRRRNYCLNWKRPETVTYFCVKKGNRCVCSGTCMEMDVKLTDYGRDARAIIEGHY